MAQFKNNSCKFVFPVIFLFLQEQQSSEDTETTSKEIETNSDDVPCSIGPQPKVDPYGQWVTVEKE